MASAFVLFLFGSYLAYVDGCRLGYTVSSITVQKNGDYKVACSAKPYPICPEYCYWTNETCDEFSKHKRWNHERHILTNITYSDPIKEHQKRHPKGEKLERDSSNDKPRHKLTLTTAVSTNVKLTTPWPKSKSIQRKCCNSAFLNVTQCKTADFKPDSSNGNKFDVTAYAKKNLKCKWDDAVVRDIRVKNMKDNQLSIDVCCLNYSRGAASVVACARWEHGGEEAAIAAAIALPLALALGIGIPLLFKKPVCHKEKFTIKEDYTYTCYGTQKNYYDLSEDACCAICGTAPQASSCAYATGAIAGAIYFDADNRDTCTQCFGVTAAPNEAITGIKIYFPI